MPSKTERLAADPVGHVDLWGLTASDETKKITFPIIVADLTKKDRVALIFEQNKYINDPLYQRGGRGPENYIPDKDEAPPTWCNQATYRIAESRDFNMEYLLKGEKMGWVSAAKATENLIASAKDPNTTLYEINGETAQTLANLGALVIGALKGSNHLATVRPDFKEYDDTVGPTIGNIGAINGVMSTTKGFTEKAWSNDEVLFFVDIEQAGIIPFISGSGVIRYETK